jgi:uncharacterized membrane protein (Fun14 family)
MKRPLVVILVGIAMTLLLMGLGTHILVTFSPDWKALASHVPRGHESLWASFMHFNRDMIAFVYVPTALLGGFFVGLFSRKHQLIYAVIATCPAWMMLAGLTLKEGVLGIGIALIGGWLSKKAVVWYAKNLA